MSLIHRGHLLVAAAAAAAVIVPWRLLEAGGIVDQDPGSLSEPVAQLRWSSVPPAGQLVTMTVFSPDRAPESAMPSGEELAAAQETTAAAPLPQLVGLVTGPRGVALALIRGGDGATQLVRRGDTVDGWNLVAFGRDSVTLGQGENRQVAALVFGKKTDTIGNAGGVTGSGMSDPVPNTRGE